MAALVAGCATTTVPPARVASTEAALKTARDSGADRDPNAKQHLTMAENELDSAKRIIGSKGDAHQAEAMLTRAKSDAALAAALSREAQQKAKAGEPEGSHETERPAQPQR